MNKKSFDSIEKNKALMKKNKEIKFIKKIKTNKTKCTKNYYYY
jgi:hypothetical protein